MPQPPFQIFCATYLLLKGTCNCFILCRFQMIVQRSFFEINDSQNLKVDFPWPFDPKTRPTCRSKQTLTLFFCDLHLNKDKDNLFFFMRALEWKNTRCSLQCFVIWKVNFNFMCCRSKQKR